ncbi:MAG TPA: hypothetical protein VLK82_12940, partial [Candidatus Tectomicrobia bacterium]|nr:hypothetical protein [Candidatus Tectomicrobia bacterium]
MPHLIGLGHPFVILNIDPWVPLPRCFIQAMTAAALSGLAKEEITHPAQVAETDAVRIPSHVSNDLFNASHMK